jgi:hypothetical protein
LTISRLAFALGAGDAAARIRPAEVKSFDWCAVLGPPQERAEREELIECVFSMKDVTGGQSVGLLHVQWRDDREKLAALVPAPNTPNGSEH